jgi:hypothetical protein
MKTGAPVVEEAAENDSCCKVMHLMWQSKTSLVWVCLFLAVEVCPAGVEDMRMVAPIKRMKVWNHDGTDVEEWHHTFYCGALETREGEARVVEDKRDGDQRTPPTSLVMKKCN